MFKHLGLWVGIIGLGFLGIGCTGAHRPETKTNFYTFEYDPPIISNKKPLSATLEVERFQISPVYDTDRIVYSEKKFTRENYNYNKWRSNPRDLVTYYVTRDLSRSRLFKAVFPHYDVQPSDYSVTGTIDEFYEHDNHVWEAVLSVTVVLLKENEPDLGKRVVFQKYYTARKPSAEKSPSAIAEAMGSAMSDISGQIVIDIYGHISEGHPK